MGYPYKKDERVLVEGFKFGTVYQDTQRDSDTVPVVLDRAKNTVSNVPRFRVAPMSSEEEARLNIELNQPTAVSISVHALSEDELFKLLTAGQHETVEPEFRYMTGDRVKLKYNGNTGTVVRDESEVDAGYIAVKWDPKYGGKTNLEAKRDIVVLHAPRATDPDDEAQAMIDQIDAIRLPLIAEIEKKQAILSKLTAAKRILKKG